eukprot:140216-Prorocentrum_minimum.AAC.1
MAIDVDETKSRQSSFRSTEDAAPSDPPPPPREDPTDPEGGPGAPTFGASPVASRHPWSAPKAPPV